MTQMNRAGLRGLRSRLQSSLDSQITENTTGAITGTILNNVLDTISTVLEDVIDSADILASASLAPAVRNFIIVDQANDVDAGTIISGTKTFEFVLTEEDNVDGNLTLTQGAATLSTTIDPKGGSFNQAVNSITLGASESVTFTLSGTAIVGAGGAAFQATFTITARAPDDFIYWGWDADGNPADFVIGTAQQAPFQSTQTIVVPSNPSDAYLVIAQKASDNPITQILIDGINQIDAFTRTDDAFSVNGALYDAYVSDHELIANIVAGDRITLVR